MHINFWIFIINFSTVSISFKVRFLNITEVMGLIPTWNSKVVPSLFVKQPSFTSYVCAQVLSMSFRLSYTYSGTIILTIVLPHLHISHCLCWLELEAQASHLNHSHSHVTQLIMFSHDETKERILITKKNNLKTLHKVSTQQIKLEYF